MKRTKQVLIVGAFALAIGGVGTASASFVINNIHQISPHVRAQLKGNRGRRGLRGFTGARGATGATGAPGATGANGISSIREVTGPLVIAGVSGSGNEVQLAQANCPAGSVATGGGFTGDTSLPGDSPIDITTALSSSIVTGWGVIVVNQTTFSPAAIHAVAECAAGPGATAAAASVHVTTRSSLQRLLSAIRVSQGRKVR